MCHCKYTRPYGYEDEPQLTAVLYDKRAEKFFLVVNETRQLVVQVAAVAPLPLLQPVEIARADQRVVSQNPGGRKRMGKNGPLCQKD